MTKMAKRRMFPDWLMEFAVPVGFSSLVGGVKSGGRVARPCGYLLCLH